MGHRMGYYSEALGKLKAVIIFDSRASGSDGQFGGGCDDIEMWRRWVPPLLGFKDLELESAIPTVDRRHLRFAEARGRLFDH